MPIQTAKEDFSYPDGLRMDISSDTGSTWSDAGVLADGVSWTFNYDVTDVENGNAANPDAQAKNLSVSIAPSALRSWDTSILEALSGGLMTREAVAGTLVEDAVQTIASGDWAYETGITLSGQNSDGTAPTINSVTAGTNGALALDTDYFVVLGPSGGWTVVITDSATVTTLDQTIEIDTDYTPAAGSYLHAGTSSKILTYVQVRLRHYTDAAFTLYDYEALFYRVRPDSGGIVLTKSGALSGNELDEWTVAITAEIESGNTDGRQLFRLYQEA